MGVEHLHEQAKSDIVTCIKLNGELKERCLLGRGVDLFLVLSTWLLDWRGSVSERRGGKEGNDHRPGY